jgi:hypothetical protein
MLREIHGTNFFPLKFLGRTNIKMDKCRNGPAQVFCFNGQALCMLSFKSFIKYITHLSLTMSLSVSQLSNNSSASIWSENQLLDQQMCHKQING